MKCLREIVQDEVLGFLDRDTGAALAQLISDFCVGPIDMTTVLSDRIVKNGPCPAAAQDEEEEEEEEAYNVLFSEEDAELCVDRSALYKESDSRATYKFKLETIDTELSFMRAAVQSWFQRLLESKRVKGVTTSAGGSSTQQVLGDYLASYMTSKQPSPIEILVQAVPFFNKGQLKFCFDVPPLFFQNNSKPEEKKMYCELSAHCINIEPDYSYSPIYHIWEKQVLVFRVDRVILSSSNPRS